MTVVQRAGDARALLGECPLWSVTEQVLYWVDIEGKAIHRFDPSSGIDEHRTLVGRPGSMALTSTPGRLLVAAEHALVWFDWATGVVTPFVDLETPGSGRRLNDGKCDPAGRFIVGSMWDEVEREPTASLYQVEADGTFTTLQTGVGVSNGLGFDTARGRMYFADTSTESVVAWDHDVATGERSNERVFLDYADLDGKPDGACVDAEGCYWSASVYGWAVIRVTPDGVVDRRVDIPVEKPSMPAFGGPDLSTMFITTIGAAGSKPSAAGRDGFQPGELLAVDVGTHGVPEPVFAGG